MKQKNYTFLEWNIRGAGGYDNYLIPKFVVNTILEKNTDVVILTEFYAGCNFDYFRQSIEDNYYIFISPFVSGYNQILIALNKNTFGKSDIYEIITVNPLDNNLPEYLRINIKNQPSEGFSIIGTRIKTQGDIEDRKKQFEFLDNQIEQADKIICVGDFNVLFGKLKSLLKSAEVYAPRIINNKRWSCTHKNGDKDEDKVGIDLIASKNIEIPKNLEDELSKKEGYKMYAKYDWDFVNKKNGYGSLTPSHCLSEVTGKPDHAVLIGNFKV